MKIKISMVKHLFRDLIKIEGVFLLVILTVPYILFATNILGNGDYDFAAQAFTFLASLICLLFVYIYRHKLSFRVLSLVAVFTVLINVLWVRVAGSDLALAAEILKIGGEVLGNTLLLGVFIHRHKLTTKNALLILLPLAVVWIATYFYYYIYSVYSVYIDSPLLFATARVLISIFYLIFFITLYRLPMIIPLGIIFVALVMFIFFGVIGRDSSFGFSMFLPIMALGTTVLFFVVHALAALVLYFIGKFHMKKMPFKKYVAISVQYAAVAVIYVLYRWAELYYFSSIGNLADGNGSLSHMVLSLLIILGSLGLMVRKIRTQAQ